MDFFKFAKQVESIVKDIVREKISIDNLLDYTKCIPKEEIDGEIIRSFFIVYNDGINKIWDRLSVKYSEYKNMELSEIMKIYVEEALEQVDFDKLFSVTINEIKTK